MCAQRADGVLIFLSFDYLLSAVVENLVGVETDEPKFSAHAPALIRIAVVRRWMEQIGISAVCRNSNEFLRWIKALLPKIILEVEALVDGSEELRSSNKVPRDMLFEIMMAPEPLRTAIMEFKKADSWEAARLAIGKKPILLTEEAEEIVRKIAVCSAALEGGLMGPLSLEELEGDEQQYEIVRRCRQLGVQEAFRRMMAGQ